MSATPSQNDGASPVDAPGLTEEQRLRRRRLQAQKDRAAEQAAQVRVIEVAPAARRARMRRRHVFMALSFFLIVVVPTLIAGLYLEFRAADQYASTVGFTVRREEGGSAIELLGGISSLGGTSSSDTDILYEFIQSQGLIRAVDARLDLYAIYGKPESDPIFTLSEDATIEELSDYWSRMVRILYDAGTGLIELEIRSFDPEDSRAIARAIFEESSDMINELSAIAREDTIGYAREELELAQENLRTQRALLQSFRNEKQIVDPAADLQGQMGLVNSLQAQLASALIELDLLGSTTREGDPRLDSARRKISVIQSRIEEERAKLGAVGTEGPDAYADVIGQFETLQADLEFAQQAYTAAQTAYNAALAEARRKSRYLAAYSPPSLAEASIYPKRAVLLGGVFLVLFGLWALMVLVFYALRDRR
ncbi:hypothetical protein [Jannaschia rubra]|uniref:Vi polysaccharide export inner membrane protein VexD n=1 Tax=Jannaschia rubra TaxID=282197 RepID=A0A0M6XSN7_9RHOB|nr:hypothetical protein [Jannaschia rubra]CTQ33195.1 Vi polysaccharide export inner membrane protein VexD [Jannaschia rubra]SFF96710.1 capsular polysaccharide transport system permease protein [Jannaschia rubra]